MDETLVLVAAVLSGTAARWQTLAATIPRELLERCPLPDQWSTLDCLRHLIDTERLVFPERVRALLDGRDFAAFDPDAESARWVPCAPGTLATEFATLRAGSLGLVATIKGADLARTATHEELGPVSLGNLLHEWGAHDLNHLVQAERAMMQPFVVGCGPWRPYFAAHDVAVAGGG